MNSAERILAVDKKEENKSKVAIYCKLSEEERDKEIV